MPKQKKVRINKSLQECRTVLEVRSLKKDNYQIKDFWIIADNLNVHISEQRNGELRKQEINVPKKDFDRLIKFYQKKQNLTQ